MRFNRASIVGCLLAATALGVAACGGEDEPAGGGGGGGGEQQARTLTIYSSLPLQGAQRAQSTAIVNGIKLALQETNNRAGNIQLRYQSLDDSTAQAGNWTPEATSANARRVAQDENAGVYIGEFNSGATAISLPLLNEAGVPQISPSNTYVGLTTNEPGSEEGEPESFYPAGTRTFARIVPRDTIQGAALATVMQEDGCRTVAMANDREVYGAGLGRIIERRLREQGINLIFNQGIDPQAPNYRSLASRARSQNADCFVFSGTTPNNAVQIFRDFAAALPQARLYGPDGVAESSFIGKEGIPADVARRTKVTVATLDPDNYSPEGRQFFQRYAQTYNERNPDPYAIYGYEAGRLAIDAIQRSQTGEREAIVQALFNTRDRDSVLGTYSIDQNGDTTLTDYGVWNIRNNELAFNRRVRAEG